MESFGNTSAWFLHTSKSSVADWTEGVFNQKNNTRESDFVASYFASPISGPVALDKTHLMEGLISLFVRGTACPVSSPLDECWEIGAQNNSMTFYNSECFRNTS